MEAFRSLFVVDQRCACGPNDWTKDGTPYMETRTNYLHIPFFRMTDLSNIRYICGGSSDGSSQYTFYDPDDYAKMETWQQGVSSGTYEPASYTTTVIEQHWSKGMNDDSKHHGK